VILKHKKLSGKKRVDCLYFVWHILLKRIIAMASVAKVFDKSIRTMRDHDRKGMFNPKEKNNTKGTKQC
jgi:hypothetical protein